MKGERLYNQLITNNQTTKGCLKKGRNTELINERNECIYHRYYYYSKILKLRYSEVITMLANDFYLSERTVTDVILNNNKRVREVFAELPSQKTLQHKFYHLNWKIQ